MRAIAGASFASLMGLALCLLPAFLAAWFAVRPSERLLALMRPLTLAGIFAALCSFMLSITNGFWMLSKAPAFDLSYMHRVAGSFAEGFAPVAASLASLTVAWVLVAVGMRKG